MNNMEAEKKRLFKKHSKELKKNMQRRNKAMLENRSTWK